MPGPKRLEVIVWPNVWSSMGKRAMKDRSFFFLFVIVFCVPLWQTQVFIWSVVTDSVCGDDEVFAMINGVWDTQLKFRERKKEEEKKNN